MSAAALLEIGITAPEFEQKQEEIEDVEMEGVELLSKTKEELYEELKLMERRLEFLTIQDDYIKDESKNLKRELIRAREEVKRIQSVPLVIGQFVELIDENSGTHYSNTNISILYIIYIYQIISCKVSFLYTLS